MSGKRESRASVVVQVRVKLSGVEALDGWAADTGVDRSEFVRGLLRAEAAARQKGRSLFVPKKETS